MLAIDDRVTLEINFKKIPRKTIGTIKRVYEATATLECYDVDFGKEHGTIFILGRWIVKKVK